MKIGSTLSPMKTTSLMAYDVANNNVRAVYELPVEDQEGITFENEGYVYIDQDTGGILKIRFADLKLIQ